MREIDFDCIIKYLEWEIARLTNANRLEMPEGIKPDISSSMTAGMVEFLTTLLQWVKSAVKVERDKIQGARDSIDATLYALISKSSLKFDDDFKKMHDHAMGNACPWLRRNAPAPQRKTYTSSEVKRVGDRLENLRLKLKSRRADSANQKITFVTQDSDLLSAVDILKTIAAEKAEAEA